MRCYYQGALQVTGGNINDVERTAMAYIEKWVYVEGSQENSGTLVLDFSDAGTVSEEDVRGFVTEAEKCGWNINGTLSYYGDYEGFMVITNNVIEEFSPEEMAVREYLDTPSVSRKRTCRQSGFHGGILVFAVRIWKRGLSGNSNRKSGMGC